MQWDALRQQGDLVYYTLHMYHSTVGALTKVRTVLLAPEVALIVSQHLSRQRSWDRPTSEASLPVRAAVMAVGLARPHLPWVVPTDMFEKYEESSIKQPGSPYPPVRTTCRHHCVAVVTWRRSHFCS